MDRRILEAHAAKDDPWSTRWAARNDAGSGAFYIEKWVPGVEMTLRANPYYWHGSTYFRRVTLYVVPSSAGRSLLGRLLLGLTTPDAGVVRFRGQSLAELTSSGR
jgi:ABC-type transport system substrate-binding protein